MPEPQSSSPSWFDHVRSAGFGGAFAGLVTIRLAYENGGGLSEGLLVMLAVLAAFGAFGATIRAVPPPRLGGVGAAVAVAGMAVVAVTPSGAMTVIAALLVGAGSALALPKIESFTRGGLSVGLGAMCVVNIWLDRTAAFRGAAALVVASAAIATVDGRTRQRLRVGRAGVAMVAVTGVLAAGLILWVGANDPTVQWFGDTYVHGPRDGNEVAITFDDGPNATWTLELSAILDDHGVKGTFFAVGKAIDARPDIVQALYDDGHLLANHSYHHDSWRWLDPRYPELDRTQDAFRRHVGVCPVLFRPPHGQRTPFMLAHVHSKGMHAVTWDVSANDWSDDDGSRIARRILDEVQPGSIILLHDSIDGNVDSDREAVRTALPLILDGLDAKGLHPVRLDELLDLPAYLDEC